jgi:hypothetical protein
VEQILKEQFDLDQGVDGRPVDECEQIRLEEEEWEDEEEEEEQEQEDGTWETNYRSDEAQNTGAGEERASPNLRLADAE